MTNGLAHRTSPAIVAAACVGALALAGCGGGSSSPASASASSASASKSAAAVVSSAIASATSSANSAASAANASGTSATVTQTGDAAAGGSQGGGGSASASAGSGPASPAAQAYAISLLPLAQAWQTAAQHYDNLVGGGSTSLAIIASSSGAFVRATNKFADSIAALKPPAGAAAAQAALVTAIRALGSDVSELESAAASKNPTKAKDAESKVGPDGSAVSNAVLALAKASQQG